MTPSLRQRLPGYVRTLHLYTSLCASFAIAFFALTGLVGELRSHQDSPSPAPMTSSQPLPLTISPALGRELRSRLHWTQEPLLRDQGDLIEASVTGPTEQAVATIAKATGIITLTRWHALEAAVPSDAAAERGYFQRRFGGDLDGEDDHQPDEGSPLQVHLVSAWWSRTITIETVASIPAVLLNQSAVPSARRWSEVYEPHLLSAALTDLHTGKHASVLQRRLMDAAAVALLLSTLSGIAMAVVWVAQRRRRLALIPLIGGAAWLLLLIGNR
jgi:hypothetical protein